MGRLHFVAMNHTEYMRGYYARNKDKVKAINKKSYQKTRENHRAAKRLYYVKHKQRFIDKAREWKKMNHEKAKESSRMRFAKRDAEKRALDAERHRARWQVIKNDPKEIARRKLYAKAYRHTLPGRFDGLRGNAAARGISVAITFEQFVAMVSQPCYYCGRENDSKGLDRVNSSVGYEVGNVVSCCGGCNLSKHVKTKSDFIGMCVLIADRYKAGVII